MSKSLKNIDKIYQEERDKRSQELFDKFECQLSLGEREVLDQYIYDLNHPQWKKVIIDNIETYFYISNIGSVLNSFTGNILTPTKNEFGYLKTNIVVGNNEKTVRIHRLVSQAFIPNPENKPEVNHINCKKWLNWVGNLEWVTSKENKEHAIKNGLYQNASFLRVGIQRPNHVYDEEIVHLVCKLLESGMHVKKVAETLRVDEWLPRDIKYNRKWKYISSQYNIPKPGEIPKFKKSEKYFSAKLTEDQVHQACKLMEQGKSNAEVSRITGINISTVSPIRLGKAWTYISSKYKIPTSVKSNREVTKHKNEIKEQLNKGNNDYGSILKLIGVEDTRENRKYIGLVKFNLKKQSSTTIDQL